MYSKRDAVKAFNELSRLAVRTNDAIFLKKMRESWIKMPVFREYIQKNANSDELRALSDFMDQGAIAEEVLIEVYQMEIDNG